VPTCSDQPLLVVEGLDCWGPARRMPLIGTPLCLVLYSHGLL
jgi:hypothetical protein